MIENLLIKNILAGTSSFLPLFNQQIIILENTHAKDMWIQHGTGRLCFITLCFTELHRFFYFKQIEGKTLNQQKDYNLLYCVVWNQTLSISCTCLSLGLQSWRRGYHVNKKLDSKTQQIHWHVEVTFCETWGGGRRLILTWGSKWVLDVGYNRDAWESSERWRTGEKGSWDINGMTKGTVPWAGKEQQRTQERSEHRKSSCSEGLWKWHCPHMMLFKWQTPHRSTGRSPKSVSWLPHCRSHVGKAKFLNSPSSLKGGGQ